MYVVGKNYGGMIYIYYSIIIGRIKEAPWMPPASTPMVQTYLILEILDKHRPKSVTKNY